MVSETIRSPGKAYTELEIEEKKRKKRYGTIMQHLFLTHQRGALFPKSVEQSVM